MPDFHELRQQLRQNRAERDRTISEISAARERLKRIKARQSELDRVFNPRNPQHVAEQKKIQTERTRAEAEIKRKEDVRDRALIDEIAVLQEFLPLADPREGIEQLNDSTPILLMPVRLETRFKRVAVRGAAAPVPQLWVRIYPDDCWLDSFDPVLTETEVANAQIYWNTIWQAGGIEDQERGAWRALTTSHGSGRASWIVREYRPLNFPQKPTKLQPQDVILTIPITTPLDNAEAAATINFWRAVWLADGRPAATADALAAFETAVGAARAAEIKEQYRPVNLEKPLAAGAEKGAVNVAVAFVIFPQVETKQSAWSQAPKLKILPERFVFIGFNDDEAATIRLGQAVPSPLLAGPDPSAPKAEQLQHEGDGSLRIPDELKWISDFDRAVEVGMGFRIDLTPAQAADGFKRVLVVGLRLSADEQEGKEELETLLRHHSFSRTGLAVVPQGTPTNNTEAVGSGFKRFDDPDQTFDDQKAPVFATASDWLDKKDGQWIAEYLGLDPLLFENVHHAGGADQRGARAMNIALWPATLGYWMETMMAPVFPRDAIEQTREFVNHYVIAGGAIPAIRIGSQPYGILPATTISRMNWLNPSARETAPGSLLPYLRNLYPILSIISQDWNKAFPNFSFVGSPGQADPHAILLDIVGLHPGSVEWSQRYAESLPTYINRFYLELQALGLHAGGFVALLEALLKTSSRILLARLGYNNKPDPFMLQMIFSGKENLLKGGVVDDKPLSESEPIRSYTPVGSNYIQWLIEAANTSLNAIYAQDGFNDDKPPSALLYLFLRHALQLGYHDVSVRLHEDAGLYTADMAMRARADDPFIHIRDNQNVSESRYQPLYATAPQITGNNTETVSQYITAQISSLLFASYLREQLAALERLKLEPTARLERLFADHIDCCSYRLDSWFLGLVNYQLALMRKLRDGSDSAPRKGIYLGAYAWLEELKPETKELTPVQLEEQELIDDFGDPNDPPLTRDSSNQGYIHAPSLNHAVAAAVLRNGFVSNASPENRQTMAVNLTSERVRTALAMLEGIRAGQGLADLLGYQFERGLHDRHSLAEVDKFIYKLRKAFPLRADRIKSTQPTAQELSDVEAQGRNAIEAIEARNVIDGLALVEHMKATGNKIYPFGKTGLPPTNSQNEADALNTEAERLLESHDAIADLALSEGVYQAVVGNYDRVASTYDAYARGHFPPEPDVIRTPLNGIGITHRVALHLEIAADPASSPTPGVSMTPRAQAEPALNRWIAGVLPPPDQVGCVIEFRDGTSGNATAEEVTLKQLGLQAIDLITLIQDDQRQAMTELDDRIVRFIIENFNPRPDVAIVIRYMESLTAPFSVFELMPLVRNVRRLVTKSRPLKPTDLSLMNEATSGQDNQLFVDKTRLEAVRDSMKTLRDEMALFQTQLEGPLADLTNRRNEILMDVDTYVDGLLGFLPRAATFGVTQAGWGFVYDFRRRTYFAILKQYADRVARWNARLNDFNARMLEEQALPAAATDQQHFDLLLEAERAISTVATSPLPSTPAAFRADLENTKLIDFSQKLVDLNDIADSTLIEVSLLLAQVRSLLPVTAFDLTEFSLQPHEDEMVRFTEDAVKVLKVVIAELGRRITSGEARFQDHEDTADPAAKVAALEAAAKAFLGDDFRIFPEINLGLEQGDELAKALTASNSGDLFEFLTNPPDPGTAPLDFPVDTWLYGVARVREKMFAWEQLVVFAESFRPAGPELRALQLPFVPDDRWLGLEFPPKQKLDRDRLLYTAHFAAPFDKTARQCGLLLDEWTEIIPTSTVDTGITFHHDRPNCEAPQTMLLVTPSEFRGTWRWNDLVDALNETLDFAKRRAIEPQHVDKSVYARFLPATTIAAQVQQLTISANLALNNLSLAQVKTP